MTEANFYAGIAKRSSEDRLVQRIKDLERRVDRAVRTPQLTRSAIDDGSVTVTSGGSLVGSVGQQFDGTNGYVAFTGPTPPVPSAPTAVTVVGGIKVSYDGTFPDPQTGFFSPVHAPQDWQRADVEVSNDPAFPKHVAPNSPNNGSIVSPAGGEVTVSWPTAGELLYVRLRTRTTAGKRSNPSTVFGPIASGRVGLGDLGFDLGTYVASNSVVYGPTQPDPAGDATRRIGTLWLKEISTNRYETWRWTGAAWVFAQDQGITQSLLDAANAQATANSKTKVISQPDRPAYTGAAGTAIWEDTDDGNRRYLWTDTSTITRRNVAINGSFQVDNTGSSIVTSWTPFSSGTTGTITRTIVNDPAVAVAGIKYLNIVAGGLGGTTTDRFGISQDIRCQPGDVIRVQATVWMTVTDTARPPCLMVNPMSSAGAFLPASFIFGSGSAVTKQTLVNTVTVPAGADHVRVYVWRQGNTGTLTLPNADLNIDAVMAEINPPTGAPTTYFDGASGSGAVWEGTAHLSPSRQTTISTSPTLDWVPRQLGSGAFQPNSVVASSILATGTVSAALMESLMILSSTVQSGQSDAPHASMMPDGFRAFSKDPVDGSVDAALQFGTANNDYISVMDNTGKPVATISDAGTVSAAAVETDRLSIQGVDYAGKIGTLSEGVVGRFSTWSSNIGPIGTSEYGLCETVAVLSASRIYMVMWRCMFQSLTPNDTVAFIVAHSMGAEGNVTTMPAVPFYGNSATNVFDGLWRFLSGGQYQDAQGMILVEPTLNTRYRFGLFARMDAQAAANSTVSVMNFASDIPVQIWVIDLGPKEGTQVGARSALNKTLANGTAGSTPTPSGNFDTDWIKASSHQSYTGAGVLRTDTTEVVHGPDPNGTFGDGRGHWGFTIPNITGTITGADLWIYGNTTGFSSGATVKVNMSTQVGVSSPTKLQTDLTVTGVPRGGSKTIELPSSWYASLKNKTAITFTVGPSGSTSQTYYTRLHGTAAYLRIWYTQ